MFFFFLGFAVSLAIRDAACLAARFFATRSALREARSAFEAAGRFAFFLERPGALGEVTSVLVAALTDAAFARSAGRGAGVDVTTELVAEAPRTASRGAAPVAARCCSGNGAAAFAASGGDGATFGTLAGGAAGATMGALLDVAAGTAATFGALTGGVAATFGAPTGGVAATLGTLTGGVGAAGGAVRGDAGGCGAEVVAFGVSGGRTRRID